MDVVSLIGIDLGKHCFHLHAQDATGRMVFRKKLTRSQMFTLLGKAPCCTVAMEACAGAHWVARRVQALGHQARLISPQFVKPFLQGGKNDFADAQAICEAASRPSMRFVSLRNEAQQTLSALHRVREALVRDRTSTANQIHAFLLEFGVSLPRGAAAIRRLPVVLSAHELPPRLIALLERLQAHFKYLDEQIDQLERELRLQLQEDERGERLLGIPGIGPITASALATELGDACQFASAAVRGVPRAGSASVQYRRQADPAGYQQAGRQECETAVGAMCSSRHAAHRTAQRPARGMGSQSAEPTAFERGGLRTGQQIGEDRLGHPRQRHTLPGRSGCCRSLMPRVASVRFTQSLPGFATRVT